jgi:cyclopropane fatty-acyl-phospholipid synthase-like methyltransferase
MSGHEATPTPTPADAIERKTSEPYTGDLSIFEDAERAANLQIDRVMDLLKISEGKVVADIGAGSGWFSVRAARRVGGKGKVFAIEINQEYVDHINGRAQNESLPQMSATLAATDDPQLKKAFVDAVLILKTYHEIAQPIRYLKNLKPGLKRGGLVGIIDRNGDGADHGVARETVIEEAKRAGFVLKDEHDFVKGDGMDYFLIFAVA